MLVVFILIVLVIFLYVLLWQYIRIPDWRIVPAGLELIGFNDEVRYLVVQMPYFWKNKILA